MSAAAAIDRDNPWPGLAYYDEAAHAFFSGRSVETGELARRIVDEPLTVLFGKSGLGKSSLLRAGVFPTLRTRGLLPVLVRLYHEPGTPAPMEQVAAAMFAAFAAEEIEHPLRRDGETLWEYLHRENLKFWTPKVRPVRPVIVLDQFEEVFTVGRASRDRVNALRAELADLAENRIPATIAARFDAAESPLGLDVHARPYKVVVSLREDFLPELEDWLTAMPSLRRNRMRLLPMQRAQAVEAVHNECTSHLVDELLARRIVDYLAGDEGRHAAATDDGADATVEPSLLSLVCRGINEARKQAGKARFDAALFESGKGRIVADFYRESVADQPPRVRRFIEDELITEQGFRNSYAVVAAVERGSMTRAEITMLVDRRLLRIEHHLGAERVELTHDLLTRPVLEGRIERVAAERVAAQRRRLMQYGAVGLTVLAVAVAFVWTELDSKAKIEAQNVKLWEAAEEAELATIDLTKLNDELETAVVEVAKQATNANIQRARAESARRLARSRELAANAIAQARNDGALALLLALEAMRTADTGEARSALWRITRNTWPSATLDANALGGAPGMVAMDPGGTRLAVVADDKVVSVWAIDSATPQLLWRRPQDESVAAMAFAANARDVFVGSKDRIKTLDAATGDPRGTLTLPGAKSGGSSVGQIATSADGRWLGASSNGRLLLYELGSEPARWTTVSEEGIVQFALTADASRISAAVRDPLRIVALERNPDGNWSGSDVALDNCSMPQSMSPGAGYVIATWKAASCTFDVGPDKSMEKLEEQQGAVEDSLASPNGGAFVAVLTNGDLVAGRGTPAKLGRAATSTIRDTKAESGPNLLGLLAVDEAATRVARLNDQAKHVRVYRVGESRVLLTPFARGTMAVTLDGRLIVRGVARGKGGGAELFGNTVDEVLSAATIAAPRWRVNLPAMPVDMTASRESVIVKYVQPGTTKRLILAIYDAATGALRSAEPLPGDSIVVGAENQFVIVQPQQNSTNPYRIVRTRDAIEVPLPWPALTNSTERMTIGHRTGWAGFTVIRTFSSRRTADIDGYLVRTADIDGYLVRDERIDRAGSVTNVRESEAYAGAITDDGRAIQAGSLWYPISPGRITDAFTVKQNADRNAPLGNMYGKGMQARSPGGGYAVIHRSAADNKFDAWLVSHGDREMTHLGVTATSKYWFSPDDRWLAYVSGGALRLIELVGERRSVRLDQIAPERVIFMAGGRLLLIKTDAGDMIVPGDAELWQRVGRLLVSRALTPGERCEYGIDEGAACRGSTAASQAKPGPRPGDDCIPPYVWRLAVPSDHVCVAEDSRKQVQIENGQAAERRQADGRGAYGADTCLSGYVWREGFEGDTVCVSVERREQTRSENSLAPQRIKR